MSELVEAEPSEDELLAIMTDTDREHITGESEVKQQDQAVYWVRKRTKEELPKGIEVLREERPDVLEELQDVV